MVMHALFAPFIAQILDSYEVTLSEFVPFKVNLFDHVKKA